MARSQAQNEIEEDESNNDDPALEQNKSDKTKIEPRIEPKNSNAIHGWSYQLKVLLLIYVRAVACGYQHFNLNTENEKEFGKFDDAIFEYVKEGETFIRLVQIKHVKEEEKEIHKQDLRIKSKYTLTKYFESFLKQKKDVKDLIIYTNLNFGDDVLTDDVFEKYTTPDDIFDVFLPDHKNIATTSLPRDHKDRDVKKIPKKYKLVYKKLVSDVALHKQFLNKIEELNNSKEFKDNGILIEQKSIQKFCDKFIFATGQTNDNEMNSVLEKEIPRISRLPQLGLVYSEYFNTFLCWLSNKYENTAPLTADDMKNIILLIELKVENLIISEKYRKMFTYLKYELEDQTIKKVKDYFTNKNSAAKYLEIPTKFPELTLAKILQCFHSEKIDECEYDEKDTYYMDKDECLILEVESNEINGKVKLIEYFKFCIIIFHDGVTEKDKNQVLEMQENNKRKVVILNNTAFNFESDEEHEDNCCFKQLQPESKANILERKVSFDGDDVPLKKFGSKKLFDSMGDAGWLSELIDGKLVLNKKTLPSLKENYIKRKLIFQLCDEESSDNETVSEASMINHGQRLIILKSEAGNGKTTLLSSMSKKYENCWTEIIKLTEHVTVLSSYQTNDDVIEFLATKMLKYDLFTAQLFKHQIEEMENVVLMFDGFDEINQKSKDAILNIIKNLLETKVHRIWIAGRPNSIEILKNHFSQPMFELTKFTDENVITLFSYYWSINRMEYKEKQLEYFCKNLRNVFEIDYLVPLYAQMAAEYFTYNTDINKINLYENFIRNKYMNLLDTANKSIVTILIREYNTWHTKLARQMLCTQFDFKHSLDSNEIEIINSIGIATVDPDDNDIIYFDNRTFAEYFLAKYVFELLTCKTSVDDKILDLLFDFFKDNKEEFRQVLDFIDEFLDNSEILPNTVKLIKLYAKLKLDVALHKQFLNKIEELNNSKEFKDNGILIEKNSIEKFCEIFLFATGQPYDNEMNSVLEKEIPRISGLPLLESVYFQYFNTFLCWLSNKYENKAPLTPDDMKIIIPLIKLKAENSKISIEYHEKLKDFKYEDYPTIKKLKNYFKFNSKRNYFEISTKFPKLTLAKILQCLEYDEMTDQGECLILETIDVELKEFEEKVKLIEYFKFCVIIFHVGVAKDYKNQVLVMLENNKSKVVILNTTAVNFESDEKSEDNCGFKHLQPESKTNILNRRISFDGEYVTLNKFASNDLFDKMEDAVWLSKLIDGKLVLKKTKLPTSEDNYIERQLIFQTNDTVDTIDFVKELNPTMSENSMINNGQRLIILSSQAGNGKTTLISSMSKKYENCWTEIIKLTEHVKELSSYQTNEDVIEFLATKILKYDSFTAQLFKHQIKEMEKVVLMFDGFDEISQNSKDAILNIIKNLLKTKVHRIWIASRPISIKILEDYFSKPIFELKKFTEKNLLRFISDYWSKNGIKYEEKQLYIFCRNHRYVSRIDFLVPFYAQMAAEYFKPTDLNEKYINRINLYENFIRKKYMNLLGSKFGQKDDGHRASDPIINANVKSYNNWHMQLALQMLYPQFGSKHSLDLEEIEIINSIGIASVDPDDIYFDHRTFAEYFLAKYVFELLTCKRAVDDKIFDLLLNFKENQEFREVLDFIDEFFDHLEILPNKIELTKPEHIKSFKEILGDVFNERWLNTSYSVITYIALDNVDVVKYKLDDLLYFNSGKDTFRSVNLLKKYFIELEKQLTSKQQLKESIILCMVQFDKLLVLKFPNPRFMKFIDILLGGKFPEIHKIVSDYVSILCLSDIGCICCSLDSDRYELAFLDFYIKIIESKSVDNFKFSIYSFAYSIQLKHSENTKKYILENLINASKWSEFNLNENGKYVKNIKFFNVDEEFFYYKSLIKAFKNQKQAFMNFLEIPETSLSYDEFEMLLTNNVEMFPKKLKNITKIIRTYLLSTRYVHFVENCRFGYQADMKPYFEKLLKYNNDERLAVCYFIQMKNAFYKHLIFFEKISEAWLGFINTLYQPSDIELIKCFCDNPFLFSICYVQFHKETKAPSNSLVYERVFDDISEIHPKLMEENLKFLIEKSLELDSLKLLKKIEAALDKEIKKCEGHETGLHESLEFIIYSKEHYEEKYFFDTMTENAKEMCKEFFVDFVKNLKIKIKAPKVPNDRNLK